MAYLVSARKWRPQTFDEIIGQQGIIKAIQNEIEQGQIAHAYLFAGPRGVGKTSLARILSKSLNCTGKKPEEINPCNKCDNCTEITSSNNIDVLEIDGASNNGVEQVREIINAVRYLPNKSQYKIYIIDEFHMLSNGAFNALLKTLEEPPPHAIFIAATTEPFKIIPTIKSRMKVFNFTPLSLEEITNQLVKVVENSNIEYDVEALFLIAKNAEGALRDALSILDVVLSICEQKIDSSLVLKILGLPKEDVFFSCLDAIKDKEVQELILLASELNTRGENLSIFVNGLIEYIRHILIMKKITDTPLELIPLPETTRKKLYEYTSFFSEESLIEILNLLIELSEKLKNAANKKVLLENYFIKISRYENFVNLNDIIKKINNYEEQLAKFGSIKFKNNDSNLISNKNNNPQTENKDVKKEYIPLNDDFFEQFLENISDENKRLVSTLKSKLEHSGMDLINEDKLEIICFEKWQHEELTKDDHTLEKIAEKEFFRIFGKKIKINSLLKNKDNEQLKEKRKNNIKIVEDLFGTNFQDNK